MAQARRTSVGTEDVRMGPVAIFTLMAIICLSVLAVLALSTANATQALAQRRAEATTQLYLDETAGILFTGDEIDPGQINMWNIPVETFRKNIVKLLGLRDKFDTICAPHNGTPVHADILRYFLENCDRLMSGIEGDEDVASYSYLLNPFEPRDARSVAFRRSDPVTRRSEWMGTAINYNVDLIFEKDLLKPHRTASPRPPEGWNPEQ